MNWKPPKPPSKFVPFSAIDSRNIEALYQRNPTKASPTETTTECADDQLDIVAVNEDHLFQVDIRRRELSPIYWSGPTYDVRRGTWFYADSSTLKPCDENLANQIEEGYLKNQPFSKSTIDTPASSGRESELTKPEAGSESSMAPIIDSIQMPTPPPPAAGSTSKLLGVDQKATDDIRPRASSFTGSLTSAFIFRSRSRSPAPKETESAAGSSNSHTVSSGESKSSQSSLSQAVQQTLLTWPLYGPHMGKYVIYSNDAVTAWIISDDFYGKFSSTIYQRLTAGASMGGIKIVRGWSDVKAKKAATATTTTVPATATAADAATNPQSIISEDVKQATMSAPGDAAAQLVEALKSQRDTEIKSAEGDEASDNRILEAQMEQDYKLDEDEDQNREIDHLILCVHGIGQKLGQRTESVNFVGVRSFCCC